MHLDDRLDKGRINECLMREGMHEFPQLEVKESVTSTSDYVFEQLKITSGQFNVCIANQQTKGRGRSANVWLSPPDANIYLSMGCCVDISWLKKINCLSLACGVSISRMLDSLGVNAGVKWPNDILVKGKKLSGILIETKIKPENIHIVVGVGLNFNMRDQLASGIDQPWIDMKQAMKESAYTEGVNLNRNQLAAGLVKTLTECLFEYNENGFESFVQDWKKFDVLRGNEVVVKTDCENLEATVQGINDDGSLRVKVGKEERSFYAADIKLKLVNYASH